MADKTDYSRVEDRTRPDPAERAVEEAVRGIGDSLARVRAEAQCDALMMVIKAVTRRGDKPDHDIRPEDAAAVFAIADILTGLHGVGSG